MSLYLKNVGPVERALRVVFAVGGGAAAFALLSAPWNVVGAVSAVVFALTGVIGYCPMCAMVGRRL